MQFAITGGFMLIDIVSGIMKAVKTKSWSSSVMREGLLHKMSFILYIVMAILCDFGQGYLELGFSLPITEFVCVYVISTEIGSAIENLSVVNPKLVPEKFKMFFIKIPKE